MENRTVLFLYPEFENLDTNERDDIISVITDLKYVINDSNRQIGKILQQEGNFSYIRCLPNIEMEEANRQPTKENIDLVRVCVIGYNSKKYEDTYDDICKQYVNNTSEISHLIGLKIKTDLAEVKFSRPKDVPFDVIIESDLENLEALLISIMLDTSLYHYFSLNNDIKYRKEFSTIKTDGIKTSLEIDAYGNIDDCNLSNIKYLPFSYSSIKEYLINSKEEDITAKEGIINELLDKYFNFIRTHVCKHLEFNKKKEISTPYSELNKNIIGAIETMVKDSSFVVGNEYFVAVNNAVRKTQEFKADSDYFMIRDDEDVIKNWLLSFTFPLNNYSLFYIKIGD